MPDGRPKIQPLFFSFVKGRGFSYAVDSVAVEVDTFNYDAEQGGLDIRMRTNTSAIKMWEAGLPTEGNNNVDENKNDMDENKKDMGESV